MKTRTSIVAATITFLFSVHARAVPVPCYEGGTVDLTAGTYSSPRNCGVPAGWILSLAGTSIPHTYSQYHVSFLATSTRRTDLTFLFREDPNFINLDDVSVADVTAGTPNQVQNPGFEDGTVVGGQPVSWTYQNLYGATFGGMVDTTPHTGINSYRDGAVQAYDGISQTISILNAHIYDISFWLRDDGPFSNFSGLSTNGNVTGTGGNGVNVYVYFDGLPPPISSIPEPASLLLVGASLVGLGVTRRSKEKEVKHD